MSVVLDVIVPVYNGSNYILQFIESFKIASRPFRDQIRLSIIDNGSTDETECLLQTCKRNGIDIEYHRFTEKMGSYAARNFGIKHSKSETVLFTDIDCQFEKNFFKQIFSMRIDERSFYGGRIVIPVEDHSNPWEVVDSGSSMKNERLLFVTACLLVRRQTFDKVGPFVEVTSGGDIDWSRRARNLGLTPVFVPKLIIRHPSRKTFDDFRVKYTRIAFGDGSNKFNNGIVEYLCGFLICLIRLPFLPTNDSNFRGVSIGKYISFRFSFLRLRVLQAVTYLRVLFRSSSAETFRS